MNLKPIVCVCLGTLVFAAPAEATVPGAPPLAAKAEFLSYSAGLRLQGTNGYVIGIGAFSERPDGRGEIYVGVVRKGDNKSGAFYRAPATVSEDFVKADLGSFGKNHPRRGRVPFNAELSERHEGIWIHRLVEGFAPADSFHFDPDLRSAALSLPSPFSGSATLRRRPNSVTPSWTGDLSLDFVGHPDVHLAGPGVYVSLTHACFSYSGEPGFAETC